MSRSSSTTADDNQFRYESLQKIDWHGHQIVYVVYCTAGQTTKNSLIYKNINYSSKATIVCSRNTVRESLNISFFCDGNAFCYVVRRPENTPNMFAGVTCRSLPSLERLTDPSLSLERPADLYLQSKFTDLILSFQVSCGSMNILFALDMFLFKVGYRNLHTSVFLR